MKKQEQLKLNVRGSILWFQGWSPSSLPPFEQGINQSQASLEATERMVDMQEKQAKCMEGLVNQQYKSALTLTLPKPEVPVFGGDPVNGED